MLWGSTLRIPYLVPNSKAFPSFYFQLTHTIVFGVFGREHIAEYFPSYCQPLLISIFRPFIAEVIIDMLQLKSGIWLFVLCILPLFLSPLFSFLTFSWVILTFLYDSSQFPYSIIEF